MGVLENDVGAHLSAFPEFPLFRRFVRLSYIFRTSNTTIMNFFLLIGRLQKYSFRHFELCNSPSLSCHTTDQDRS